MHADGTARGPASGARLDSAADSTGPGADGTGPAADGTGPGADGTGPAADGTGPGADGAATPGAAREAATPGAGPPGAGPPGAAGKDAAGQGIPGKGGKTRDGKRTLSGIGAVAGRTGVSERTLRYYEELGLLRPTAHRRGGSRLYCEADVERVAHIRELQALMGFNLEEIRGIVAATDRLDALRDEYYKGTADSDHQRELLEEAARTLEDLRAQVMAKRDHLESFLAKLDARIERNRKRLATGMNEPAGDAGRQDGAASAADPLAYGVCGINDEPHGHGGTADDRERATPAGEPAR